MSRTGHVYEWEKILVRKVLRDRGVREEDVCWVDNDVCLL